MQTFLGTVWPASMAPKCTQLHIFNLKGAGISMVFFSFEWLLKLFICTILFLIIWTQICPLIWRHIFKLLALKNQFEKSVCHKNGSLTYAHYNNHGAIYESTWNVTLSKQFGYLVLVLIAAKQFYRRNNLTTNQHKLFPFPPQTGAIEKCWEYNPESSSSLGLKWRETMIIWTTKLVQKSCKGFVQCLALALIFVHCYGTCLILQQQCPMIVKAVHFLWSHMFLNLYASEVVHCAISGGDDESTFCYWSWLFASGFADLPPQAVRANVSTTRYNI